jgi:hypothetical protein
MNDFLKSLRAKEIEENNKIMEKKAIRLFTPGTKFTSRFGAEDIVNEKDLHRFDPDGNIFVLGKYEYRLIYDGYWATIHTE